MTMVLRMLLLVGVTLGAVKVCGQTLAQRIRHFAATKQAKIGVYACVPETGDTVVWRAGEHFPMQSVYKFPIAMAVLDGVDKRRFSLDQPVVIRQSDLTTKGHSPIRQAHPHGGVTLSLKELLRYSVSESDGSACDILIGLLGGVDSATFYLHQLGIEDLEIATTEEAQQAFDDLVQYRNRATPRAMTSLLTLFATRQPLSSNSEQLLMDLMIHSYGDRRIKGKLPAGTVVAHKTGTAATVYGFTRATNDVGIISLPSGRHIAVSIFVSDTYASQEEREAMIATIAQMIFDAWKDR